MRSIDNKFYRTKEWLRLANYIRESRGYTCNRCGEYGNICHHIIHLNENNYKNPEISLNEEYIELLCYACHNKEHLKNNNTVDNCWFKDGELHNIAEVVNTVDRWSSPPPSSPVNTNNVRVEEKDNNSNDNK